MTTIALNDLLPDDSFIVSLAPMDVSFNGAPFPRAGTSIGPLFSCGPNAPSSETCFNNPLTVWAYPDPVSGVCPPPGSDQFTRCVNGVSSGPPQNFQWLRSTPLDPAVTTVRVDVTLHVIEGLFERSFGESRVDVRFSLNVDRATGTVTPVLPTDGFITLLEPNCATMHSGVPSGGKQPKFCWDIRLGPTFPEPQYPPAPWDVVGANAPTDQQFDLNGFLLNPRWRWQTTDLEALGWDACAHAGFPSTPCVTQPLEINAPDLVFQNPRNGVLETCYNPTTGVAGQHTNWQVVTYQGRAAWSGHSDGTFQDDDYNIRLLTPLTTDNLPSGMTSTNERDFGDPNDIKNTFVMMEFEEWEVGASFVRSPYWSNFMSQVRAHVASPQGINGPSFEGTEAIAIGLLGTDQSHDSKSELHTLFALALHTNTNASTDTWDMFARNLGDEGLCSSHQEALISAAGWDQPYDLMLKLPRPPGVDANAVPAVAAEFGKAEPIVPLIRMRMTSVDLGSLEGPPPTSVSVGMETHFNGAVVPPQGQPGPMFWCDPDGPSDGSTGDCFTNRNPWAYPDPVSHVCPAPGSAPTARCVGSITSQVDSNWMRSVPLNENGPTTERIDVILHTTGLFDRSFGVDRADVRFTLNYDRTTQTTTVGSFDTSLIKTIDGTCATMHSGAPGGNDPKFCWKIENVPVPPPPPPTRPHIEVVANMGQSVIVVFHMPPPPHENVFLGGTTYAGEVRINWNGGTPPPPASQPLASGPIGPSSTEDEGVEPDLSTLFASLTPEQLAIYDSLAIPLPTLSTMPAASAAIVAIVGGSPPPPSGSPITGLVSGVPPIQTHRESVTRAFCAALGGQLPADLGSCAVFPPATKLTNSGTAAASGWFTSPITITLTAIDAGGSGIDHTEYSVDGGITWTPYTAPFVAPEGAITISYRSVDHNGLVEPYQQQPFQIDTRPPTSAATANALVQPAILSFTVTDPTPGSGPAGIHTVSRVGNTTQLDNRFTPGATGTVVLNTQCTDIEYWGEDVAGLQETTHHHLTDSAPPQLRVPANVTVSTCTTGATVQVGQATATDECLASVPVTGQVIATNGTTLPTPIPVVGGSVALGIGVHTIRWSATDGLHPVTGTQTVTVGVRIEANQSFTLEDRASVLNDTGGFSPVLNRGTGTAQVGNDARSGAVISIGPIRVLHRAVVNGDATSGSTVFKESDGTITGTIRQNVSVVLPAFATLPSFPSPTAGNFAVTSGTVTKNPGSYGTASISGGTLVLLSGDYFFQSLTIEANVTVRATPTTRVFVRDTFAYRSPFRASSGTAVQSLFVGFAGSAVTLEAPLNGTLLAPNATVNFGVDTSITFIGSYFGRAIDVRPDSVLRCK